jgi:diamine N-acetyltransferase
MPELVTTIVTANGAPLTVRPLAATDTLRLGAYFVGLSAATRRRFGPHPLDAATAVRLCASLNPAQVLRMVATIGDEEAIVAYLILLLGVTEHEQARYAMAGLSLDPALDCTVAPSVADAYQNLGIGSPCLGALIHIARDLGRRVMVLLGGVQATNERAVHVYRKHGFETVGSFEYPAGVVNIDMWRLLAADLQA